MSYIASRLRQYRVPFVEESSLWEGLIVHCPVNEASGNALDVVGGNDLTVTGSPIQVPGMVDFARDLNGSDQWFERDLGGVSDNPFNFVGGTRTYAVWVNPDSVTSKGIFQAKELSPAREAWYVNISSSQELRHLNYEDNQSFSVTNLDMANNRWWLCVHTATDGVGFGLSLNGQPWVRRAYTGVNRETTDLFQLGRYPTAAFNGHLGPFMVWERELGERELYELFRSGPGSLRDDSNIVLPNFDAPVIFDERTDVDVFKRNRRMEAGTNNRCVGSQTSVPITIYDKVVCAFRMKSNVTNTRVGIGDYNFNRTNYVGSTQSSWGYSSGGDTYHNAGQSNTGYDSANDGNDHEIVIAFDGPNTSLYVAVDGVWQGGSDPALGINAAYNNLDRQVYFFLMSTRNANEEVEFLTEEDMQIAMPAGYKYAKHDGGFGNHPQFGTSFVGGQIDRIGPFLAEEDTSGTAVHSIGGDHWIQLYDKNYQLDYVAIEDDFNSYYGWGKDFTAANSSAQSQGPDSYAWRNSGGFGNSLNTAIQTLSSWKDTTNSVITFRFEDGDVFAYLNGVIENSGNPIVSGIHGTIKVLASFDDGGDKGMIAVDPPFGLLDGAEPMPMGGATGLFREAVGSWGLDESTTGSDSRDRFGNRNDLIVNGVPGVVAGPFGGARDCFLGGTGFFQTSQVGLGLAAGDFAVSVHIYPTDSASFQATFGCGIVSHMTGSANQGDWWLGMDNNGEIVFTTFQIAGANATGLRKTTTLGATNNNWYHVVAVLEGGVTKIYVNGVEQTVDAGQSTASGWANTGFQCGAYQFNSAGYYYGGRVAELNIFPRAVTQAEVTTLQTTPFS